MYGKCEMCGKEGPLVRTYFSFPEIKCECHSPHHFERVEHCENCKPIIKLETKLTLETYRLRAIDHLISKHPEEFQTYLCAAQDWINDMKNPPVYDEPIPHNKIAAASNGCEAMYLDN